MSYPSDLFRAIFTPGVPPALFLATNASFALLQVTLLVLLFATSSWHFFFLSILCAGVWGGINWFVREVEMMKKVEERAMEIRRVQGGIEKEKDEDEEEENVVVGRSTAMEMGPEIDPAELRKVEDEDDDDFEKVEKEDGYETEGRKTK